MPEWKRRRKDAQLLDGPIAVWFLKSLAVSVGATASIEAKLADLSARVDSLAAERDQYRKLYLQTLELCRKLELGIIGPKRERLSEGDAQLTMSMLGMLLGDGAGRSAAPPAPPQPPVDTPVAVAHTRQTDGA